MRTLTLIRKTVSPADPPVTLPCLPPKRQKPPPGRGRVRAGFPARFLPCPRARGTGPLPAGRGGLGRSAPAPARQEMRARGFLASKIPGQCVRPPGGTPLPHRLGDKMGRERRPHPSGEAVGGTGPSGKSLDGRGPGRPAALKGGIRINMRARRQSAGGLFSFGWGRAPDPRALEVALGRGRLSAPCAESPAPLSTPGPACSPFGTWPRRGPVPRPCRTSRRPRRSPPWSPRPHRT